MARLNNLLVATTAMVALTTAASANTISGTTPITTTQYTSESTDAGTATELGGPGINVSGSAVISVTAGAAIEISGTGPTQVSNSVNISSSAILRSDQVSGTIAIMPDSAGNVTINNSGTIINLGANGFAISGTDAAANEIIRINNSGTISGSISTGAAGDIFNNTGNITGNINLGAGINNISNSGVISGSITTAGGDDIMEITGGRIVGAINLGAGTDTMYVSGTGFTTSGSISGVERVNVSSTLNIQGNGFSTDLTTLTVGTGATANVSTNTLLADTANSLVNVSGTLNIAAGKSVSASTISFAGGGTLGIHISDSASYGYVERDGAGSFTGGSLTVHLGNAFINSGTQFRIVSATGGTPATITPSLTTTTQGLYTFYVSTTDANNGVSLTIYRAATSSAAGNSTNAGIANVLDNVSSSTNTTLSAIQGLINQQTSTAGVNTVLEKLNPAVDTGAALASVDVAVQTGGQISQRLAGLRGGNSLNTGDGMFSNHFWMQGFGNITEQDDKDGRKGYDANTYGASFGLDTDTIVDGATTGMAFSYGKSTVDSNNANGAQTDVDNYLITLYGSRVYDQGVFINALGSVGFGQYETSRNTGVGPANGEFDGMQYSAKLEVGKDFTHDWWTITPAASAQYTYVDMDKYTETGTGATLNVDSQSFNAIDLGLGGTVAYNIPLQDGGTLSPRIRAKYIYRAGDDSVETNSRFVAGGAAFSTQGVEADRSSLNLGAGILLSTVGGVDLSADYDADIRDSLVGHTGQLKARWAF